jgi:SPP1 gp7 family putative phage head morphogenesis protein
MAQNISDQFASELMAHSIDLGRFEAHEREVLLKIFRVLESELIEQLRKFDPTDVSQRYQRQRVEALLAYVRPIVRQDYTQIGQTNARDLKALAIQEAAGMQALGAELVVDTLFSIGVPQATIRALVTDGVIEGRTLRQWWSRQASTTLQRYGETIMAGTIRGDSVNDMVRTLRGTRERQFTDGVFGKSRRDLTTLVRTSTNSIANESRMETFRANEDVLRGIEYLTALDAVVCPICRPYSGQAYTMDGKRLPGTTLPFPGNPPIHPNCRCMWLPVIRPYRDLSKAKGPRFESEVQALPQETKDALDGGLGVDLSLPVWLRQQPEATQRQILGPARHKLWQQGKLSLTGMVSAATGRPLTLEQLTARRRRRVA